MLTLVPLLFFLDRPLAIDDTLFVKSAQQILHDPLRPMNTIVDWYGNGPRYLWVIAKNPPGLSYWLAAGERIVGPSEVARHVSLLPFAIAAALAGLRLTQRFAGGSPYVTASWLASPAFLVSASTLMPDVPALALGLWGLTLYIEGVDTGHGRRRRLGALLAGLAVVVKYTAVVNVAALVLYPLLRQSPPRYRARRPFGMVLDLWPAALPLLAWSALGLATYGRIHVYDALTVVGGPLASRTGWFAERGIAVVTFIAAAGVFPIVFVIPAWRTRTGRIVLGVAAVLGIVAGVAVESIWPRRPAYVAVAVGVLAMIGVCALALACRQGWRSRAGDDRGDSMFLAAWMALNVVFAWSWSWTIAARFILPVLPPLALLLAQVLRLPRPRRRRVAEQLVAVTAVISLAVATLVLRVDALAGEFHRSILPVLAARAAGEGRRAYFVGGWGFYYYAERAGMRRLDGRAPASQRGDFIVEPYYVANNDMPKRLVGRTEIVTDIPGPVPTLGLHTMNARVGAGFYSTVFGPLPFAVGERPVEGVRLWRQTE